MTDCYTKSKSEVLSILHSRECGLSQDERSSRQAAMGENSLGQAKKPNYVLKFLSQFKDIMVIILLCAAVVSLVFALHSGKVSEMVDTIVIFAIVLINAILGFAQEVRAENALENLKKMSQPYSTILVDGVEKRVKTSELVPGDVVVLEAGDIVPADLYLLESIMLRCDESALTGESQASEKKSGIVLDKATPLADRKNMCYASSTIVYGRGKGVVAAIGRDTEVGKIAVMLSSQKKELTPLQKSLNKLGEIITFVVLAIAIVIFLIDVIFAHHGYIDSFLTAVAIAVAAIPESLPAVVTIILSIGVTRLAKKNAIIKKLHAVETLGCCEVICSDKTGTITQNKMSVASTFVLGEKLSQEKMLECMAICNDAKINGSDLIGDPTEIALVEYFKKQGGEKSILLPKRLDELPFDSSRKMMSVLAVQNKKLVQYTKGGVDEILQRCSLALGTSGVESLSEQIRQKILSQNSLMAGRAQRVLALCYKDVNSPEDFCEKDLIFVGLVGMIDPPRDEVFEAINKCKKAGIKTIMITGDHKTTATAIALSLGMIDSEAEVINGRELDHLGDKELDKAVHKYKVFARVSPEHKVRIVESLKRSGKIVAMTGDGVNDAPSLKAASIGIGMGKSGTEVAKSVADMILTDDNFATIVLAVEEGRNIFSNIQKTIQFLLSCNIAEVLTIFFITMFFPKYIFLSAVQILFINLVTDTFPSVALGVDKGSKDTMSLPPRNPKEYIIGGRVGLSIIYQGIIQTILSIAVYLIGLYHFSSSAVATTMAFMTINMLQLFHMYNIKSSKSIFSRDSFNNRLLNIAFVLEMLFLFSLNFVPFLTSLVGLVRLSTEQWLVTIFMSMLIIPFCEIAKAFQNKNIK